ncbi:hypothetical protein E4T56_gene9421, partial [Termitomyces sp. T112]
MVLGPRSCVQEDDFHSHPFDSFSTLSSGRSSPYERQNMLAAEATPSTRHAAVLDNVEALSSYDPPIAYSRPYDNMPPSSTLTPSVEFSPMKGPQDTARYSKISPSVSYKGVPPSPLNPAIPSGPHVFSPFHRPGSRESTRFMRMPSEESRALSSGPLTPTNPSHTRGSMILYRKAEIQDDVSLPPLPYAKHNTMLPVDPVPLSSDSKYPVGTMILEHGLVAYAWDPLVDDLDDEDTLDEKLTYDSESSMSLRGLINIASLILLLSALLCLFVMYPIYRHFTDNGRNELIVGNTRINSTGQATFVEFDPRSQMPIPPLSVVIDPATPQEALTRSSKDGVSYRLIFSDEFNTDGRSFYGDDDLFWEAVDDNLHDHKLITTQNGYLIIKSRTVSVRGSQAGVRTNGSLKQRTSYCL